MSAEFVACMEDVLDLYAEPYDPERPVVCFDETSKQLLAEKRSPIPPKPARRERYDYEYQRNGTRNLFMLCEPLAGWRHVAVTERRTMVDFAKQMRWLADEAYPASEKIRVVLDNLNTHKPASLYETFEPKEARRIRSSCHSQRSFLCPQTLRRAISSLFDCAQDEPSVGLGASSKPSQRKDIDCGFDSYSRSIFI